MKKTAIAAIAAMMMASPVLAVEEAGSLGGSTGGAGATGAAVGGVSATAVGVGVAVVAATVVAIDAAGNDTATTTTVTAAN